MTQDASREPRSVAFTLWWVVNAVSIPANLYTAATSPNIWLRALFFAVACVSAWLAWGTSRAKRPSDSEAS